MNLMSTASLTVGLLVVSPWALAQTGNPCDLNQDNLVNMTDVQLIVNMTLGVSPCSANIMGSGVCNVIVVQRVVNAAAGNTCVTGALRTVSLTWIASTSTVAGYNVYRATVSGGPYTKVNSSLVPGTMYLDAVPGGQTYYYVATAVDASQNESVYSNAATAVVPSP